MEPDEASPRGDHRPPVPRIAADRILVIRLGALGDVVRTRFAVAGLRELYPDARLDWLVEDRCRAGLDGILGIDRIIEVPRRMLRPGAPRLAGRRLRELVASLRDGNYDLALDFHGVLKSGVLARASSTRVRVGYAAGAAREQSHRFYTHRVALPRLHVSRFERNAALIRFLGGEVPTTPPPLELPAAALALAASVETGRIVLHPGTSARTAHKRWNLELWSRLAQELRSELGEASLVTFGPGERPAAERVVAASGGAAELAPETPSVAHLIALLERSRLFVGSDSGPLHLAALAGRPVVVLIGPTDPTENAPFPGLPARLVRHDAGCNPCRDGCPARACMAAILPRDVLGAVRDLLEAVPATNNSPGRAP
ncbi:MAG: glycosyltransferase family 9 protein [Myxococcales bacterium]|nr:glycosyltransferase family 9 protein [Myxococcales bacterium]